MAISYIFNPFTSNFDAVDDVTLAPVGSSPNADAGTVSGNVLTLQPANTSFPGVLTAADWNTFNNAATQVNAGPTTYLYVDQNYVGAATSDGSVLRPYLTITAALNRIIANNDGNNYVIYVHPGTYTGGISLNNAAFTRLAIISSSISNGNMSNDAIPVTSLDGDINSTSNNDNLKALIFQGFDLTGDIVLTGASNGTNFLQYGGTFSNMMLYSTGAPAITANNLGQLVFQNCGSAISGGAGGVSIQNAGFFGVYSTFFNLGAVTIVTNGGANKPSGFGATSVNCSFGNFFGPTSIDAGSALVLRYTRCSGAVTNAGTLTSVATTFLSAVANSGSWSDYNSSFVVGPTGTAPTQSSSLYLPSGDILVGNASNLAKPVAMSGDITISNTGATTLANIPNKRYIDFVSGSDSNTGTLVSPWKTLQHAYNSVSPTINVPYVFYLSGGNNDSDVGTITGKPNVGLVSENNIQINALTITGGSTNDTVWMTGIELTGTFTWVRNDTSAISLICSDVLFASGCDFEQQGAGAATSFIYAANGFIGPLTVQAGTIYILGAAMEGAIDIKDAGSGAFAIITASDLYLTTFTLNGGLTFEVSGCIADSGYTILGVTTGSGTPTIISDSGSLPPPGSITGAFTLQLTSQAPYVHYSPAVPGNWSVPPTQVAQALDELAAIVPLGIVPVAHGGTGSTSLTLNNVILGNGTSPVQFVAPGTSGNVLTSNGTTWTSAPSSVSPGSISLTTNHILVGNGSNVAADVAMSGDVSIVASGATTINKIQGTTVSGTTGTGNVVFSASPTLTGTITAAAANFSGAITASNFSGSSSGTNTGDVTLAAVGASPNANAASLSGQVLNLQPFSSAFPGVVTASGGGTVNFLRADGTWATPPNSGGTVTSVALTVPSFLSISGSPITTSGTLAVTLSGTALPIANGGTGQTTASAAFGALSPLTTKGDILGFDTANNRVPIGTDGFILTADSTQALGLKWAAAPVSGITQLTGDVTAGPGSGSQVATLATVNANVGSFGSSTSIPSFTVNAKGLITAASGNVVIAPAGTLTGTTLASNVVTSSLTSVGTITSGTWNGTTIAIANGGTGQTTANAAFNALSPMTTAGDIIYENSTPVAARLGIGSTGQVLTVSGGLPVWAAPATSGTVTSVALTVPAFLSVSGSPITSSGTLAVTLSGTALPVANGGTGDTSFTAYSVITGGTTSTGALQNVSGVGTTGQVLTSNGASALPTWQNASSGSTPTVQRFTSGSGTYTTPANVKWIEVKMIGGGGGGGAATTNNGTAGSDSTFGTSLLTAGGGSGGSKGANGSGAGPVSGGTPTINSPAITMVSVVGGSGWQAMGGNNSLPGGPGGNGFFGGAGSYGNGSGSQGFSAETNSGAGGGGAKSGTSGNIGAVGGAAGGYLEAIINTPSATYAYAVGAGGAGGAAGEFVGGNGGSGVILVIEHY